MLHFILRIAPNYHPNDTALLSSGGTVPPPPLFSLPLSLSLPFASSRLPSQRLRRDGRGRGHTGGRRGTSPSHQHGRRRGIPIRGRTLPYRRPLSWPVRSPNSSLIRPRRVSHISYVVLYPFSAMCLRLFVSAILSRVLCREVCNFVNMKFRVRYLQVSLVLLRFYIIVFIPHVFHER